MKALRWGGAAIAGSFVLLLGIVVLLGGTPTAAAAACGGPSITVNPSKLPNSVAGYTGDQLTNAAAIITAGAAAGVDAHGQTIGVMTALGESGLHELTYGDQSGPDSRGLFQQRGNGAWGTLADRMNPTISATNFFHALLGVPGWDQLPPTLAAHAVQHNADPYYYEPYWAPAQQLVTALTGVTVPGTPAACNPSAAGSVPVGPGGWVKPAAGPVTSPYGWRTSPTRGVRELHSGTDLGAPCGAPIYAAATGTVVRAGPSTGYGNLIAIDHGGGIVTRYAHMYNDGVLVHVGQPVTAGQQIATVGANGDATACHLHYEVQINGEFTDPQPFMAKQGAPL